MEAIGVDRCVQKHSNFLQEVAVFGLCENRIALSVLNLLYLRPYNAFWGFLFPVVCCIDVVCM